MLPICFLFFCFNINPNTFDLSFFHVSMEKHSISENTESLHASTALFSVNLVQRTVPLLDFSLQVFCESSFDFIKKEHPFKDMNRPWEMLKYH